MLMRACACFITPQGLFSFFVANQQPLEAADGDRMVVLLERPPRRLIRQSNLLYVCVAVMNRGKQRGGEKKRARVGEGTIDA